MTTCPGPVHPAGGDRLFSHQPDRLHSREGVQRHVGGLQDEEPGSLLAEAPARGPAHHRKPHRKGDDGHC